MFKNIKPKDLVQLLIIVLIAITFGYLYVNNSARNKIWLQTYPIRAAISNHQISCSPNAPKWMSELITNQTINGNAPSNQIAYIDQNNQLFHCENGYMGEYPLLSKPINAETRFRYASVTKLWTSDAILDLIKQGKLSFDTPIVSILTEVKNPQDKRVNAITVGQLLLHRGGFDRYTVFGGNDMFGVGEDICPNHVEKLNSIKLNFNPNEKMSYSNLGYCLLGEIIHRINQRTYINVINDKYSLARMGIKFIDDKPLPDEVFYNYVETDLTGFADIYTAFNYRDLASVAGLSGNAVDLAKQVRLMIEKPSPNIMTLSEIPCHINEWQSCYGYATYGYQKKPTDEKIFYRNGSLLGLSSMVAISNNGQIITVLSNGSPLKAVPIEESMEFKIYSILNNN